MYCSNCTCTPGSFATCTCIDIYYHWHARWPTSPISSPDCKLKEQYMLFVWYLVYVNVHADQKPSSSTCIHVYM